MISFLSGKVKLVKENFVVLDVAGVGYKVFIGSKVVDLKDGQELGLYTHLAVRENAMDLFGFVDFIDLQLFELLISISGIGPKVGLAIMNLTTPESLKRAVLTNNTEELTKISGLGKKTAQKIILELQNKIDKIDVAVGDLEGVSGDVEIYETLETLGFDRQRIRDVLPQLKNTSPDDRIKEALKILSQN